MNLSALMVIDIQRDFTEQRASGPFPLPGSPGLIRTANGLIEAFHERGLPVIFVRHEFTGIWGWFLSKFFCQGLALSGTEGAGFNSKLKVVGDKIFVKTRGDAFSNLVLAEYLLTSSVEEVHLVGLDARFCIKATARGAMRAGLKVTIVGDGIISNLPEKLPMVCQFLKSQGAEILQSDQVLEKISRLKENCSAR